MSKYRERGAYHRVLFATPNDPYRLHMLDVLEKANRLLPRGSRALDFGCGEGLLIEKLRDIGITAIGWDADREAVRLGRRLGNEVWHGRIRSVVVDAFNAVFVLDVLEHVAEDEFQETVDTLLAISPLVFAAVPDRHDRHGVRDFTMESLKALFGDGWECLHSETRHARHLVVMRLK